MMANFKDLFGLLFVHRVIDCTQIYIHKPKGMFVANYFSYKSKVHNM